MTRPVMDSKNETTAICHQGAGKTQRGHGALFLLLSLESEEVVLPPCYQRQSTQDKEKATIKPVNMLGAFLKIQDILEPSILTDG